MVVLERCRRWPPGTFPRDLRDVDRMLWRYPEHRDSRGLFELRSMSGIYSVTASGVGGGSLIYASIHYRPQAEIFEDPRWPQAFNPESLDSYYDMVAGELGVEVVPPDLDLAKRTVFHEAAGRLGREELRHPQAVSWEGVFGSGADRQPCQMCAECEFGCNHGSKNTLDFTYLAKAESAGAQVETGRNVSHIAPADDKGSGIGWDVHYVDTETGERGRVTGSVSSSPQNARYQRDPAAQPRPQQDLARAPSQARLRVLGERRLPRQHPELRARARRLDRPRRHVGDVVS